MPGVLAPNVVGRREFLMDMLFLADNRDLPFTSMARKPKSSADERNGIPNSQIGSYQAKVYGDIKAGGVADGRDVSAYDAQPVRELISFRPEKYWRHPMVGDLAKDDVIAGVASEWNEALQNETVMHKRDMEKELLSDQDSSSNGGAEGGTTTRGIGKWLVDSTGSFAELPVPLSARIPTAQIYASTMGDGMASGLTEDVVQALFQARRDNTGSSNKLTGFLGFAIKRRFGLFSKYKPNISNTTVVVRTNTDSYTSGDLNSEGVDIYMSDWGSFSIIPVNTIFLPDTYTGYILDLAQVEVRSRYWMREKDLPDLGGGPRREIASFIALIPGDLRSHVSINASA